MRRIASRQNPVVARFRAAARGETRGLVLLDGVHLVAEAIDAGVTIHEAAVSVSESDQDGSHIVVAKLERAGVPVVAATAPVMAALSPVRSPSSVVALAAAPASGDLFAPTPACVLVIVGVQDPGNVGAMLRVAEAAGATGAIVAGGSADPFGWKALRGSMGSALRLPVRSAREPARDALADARRRGCRIVATVPRGGEPPSAIDFTGPVAIAIGGEGPGLAPELVAAADARVSIPMAAPVESLNAAVTAALVLYEVRRQRTA
jgi:TrmH family RNA methyltransferase